jgi:hypothetical protein
MRSLRGGVTHGITALVILVASSQAYSHTTLFAPNGGEQLISGDTFSILWEISISHALQNWDLWYSSQSQSGPWIDIATDIPPGDPSVGSLHSFDWTVPNLNATNAWVRVRMDNAGQDYFDVSDAPFSIAPSNPLLCDFTGDGICDISDLNELLGQGPVAPGVAVTAGVNDQYDLNSDQVIDNTDVDEWLADAATNHGFGSPYNRGDANLDGVTDGQDFILWNENRFQPSLFWDRGNFNGDGFIDAADFIEWNQNKFTASDSIMVPEPCPMILFSGLAMAIGAARRRQDA